MISLKCKYSLILFSFIILQLKSLLDCRVICDVLAKTNGDLIISDAEWTEIETIVDVLSAPFHVTKLLQKVDFTMSDFYAAWLELKFRLNNFSHKLAKCLLTCMEGKKHQHLLQNPMMLCSVYLDPRLKADLIKDGQQCYVAKGYLAKLWERIDEFSHQSKTSDQSNPPAQSSNKFDYSYLTNYLSSLECPTPVTSSAKRMEFTKLLNVYEKTEPVNMSVSVLDFWEQQRDVFPELYKIAKVVHAVPATQSSVERTFSTLSFVFNKLRSQLSETMLEDILLIKLNADLFNQIAVED